MKKMPQIVPVQKSQKMTTNFLGYNHNEVIMDGEMHDMMNLSGELYPVLAPRRKRGITSYDVEGQAAVPLNGIHGRDQLVMIRGTEVFYNFIKVEGVTVSTASSALPKKIVSMGAYVCIWPDKVYFNTTQLSDCGDMGRSWSAAGQNVSMSLCRADGTNYDMTQITVSATAPSNPTNGKLWIDQSGEKDVLRQYSSARQEWVEVPTVYIKISGSGIGSGISVYDGITISGMEAPDSASARVKAEVAALNAETIIYGCGENYIIVSGILSGTVSALKSGTTARADRKIPDLDFICESNNRLWGCRYGMENGKTVNELRACKLGDFKNWSCFMGISTDSYRVSVGTDGEWTGAITQRGYPVFFKEECIHRVSGNMPSSFSVQTTVCRGVQKGSWRSLAVVNEAIYYKGRSDVMVYDGNMPIPISDQLGGVQYEYARGGALKDKFYYLVMKERDGVPQLFVYNAKQGIWYKEGDFRAEEFATVGDELFAIVRENGKDTLQTITGSMGTLENDFPWFAEFGISGVEYGRNILSGRERGDFSGRHYMSRFDIRMWLEDKHEAKLEIQYNSDGEWTDQGTIRGKDMRSFVLPVIPKRCDHLRFRISGTGKFRIYSISRILEVGSDA